MSYPTERTWTNDEVVKASYFNEMIRDALRYLKGLDGNITIEDALELEDIGTPVGNIRLKVIDEVLQVRNAADDAYKKLKFDCFPVGSAATEVAEGDHTHTISEDFASAVGCTLTAAGGSDNYFKSIAVAAADDYDVATTTQTFAADTLAGAMAWVHGDASIASQMKLRLIMGGTQVAESGYMPYGDATNLAIAGTWALSGEWDIIARLHNYHVSTANNWTFATKSTGEPAPAAVAVGSVYL
ncbi:MAG: hypothetical protein KKC55_13825 [Gammaproteobacteria bacterium]|nr:hypothetical protein [Gammaproteobacteria bacterium]